MNITQHTPSTALLPTVRNLEEAWNHAAEFSSVLTAGPGLDEVGFNHPDHLVVSFDDVESDEWGYQPPTFEQVREMVEWGRGRENLLVHCHAGISRSTATAWGIAIANGFDPNDAIEALRGRHPQSSYAGYRYRRMFHPNGLIVRHLEQLFALPTGHLAEILEANLARDHWRPAERI